MLPCNPNMNEMNERLEKYGFTYCPVCKEGHTAKTLMCRNCGAYFYALDTKNNIPGRLYARTQIIHFEPDPPNRRTHRKMTHRKRTHATIGRGPNVSESTRVSNI